jgi:hypothetical protein
MVGHYLRKLLRIREGEGQKVLEFAVLAALLQAGVAIGMSAADSLFLTHVGAEKLPVIYLIVPLIMLVYVPLSAFGITRTGVDGFLKICLVLVSAGGILLSVAPFLVQRFFPQDPKALKLLYYFIKLYAELWAISMFTLMWNFVDEYFDILDAKRLFSFFSGGMAFGTMIGGVVVTVLASLVPVEQLFFAWTFLAGTAFPVVRALKRKWPKMDLEESDKDLQNERSALSPGTLIRSFFNSAFALSITITILATLMVTTLCEFQSMNIFEEGRNASQIALLFGKLFFTVSCFNIILNLFFFNRLVLFLGVRAVALIQPIAYAVTFSFFILRHGFGAAIFGFFIYQGILVSIEYNNQNFLFNALPKRGKAALRTLIEGLCEPLATALMGLFLMAVASRILPETLSVIGLSGAVVTFCLVAWLRNQYGKAMVTNLRSSWLDFSGGRHVSISQPTVDELKVLDQASRSTDRSKAIPAIERLWVYDRMQALEALLNFLDNCTIEDQVVATPQLAIMLREDDAQIYRRVLLWSRTTSATLASSIVQELGRYNLVDSEDVSELTGTATPESRAAASVAFWHSWKLDDNLQGVHMTQQLMKGSQEERIAAIRSIGKLSQPKYTRFLADYLQDPSPAVRKQTLMAMFDLVKEGSEEFHNEFLEVIKKGDWKDRLIGLDALMRMKNTDCIRSLVAICHDFSPYERRKTETLIQQIGLQSVPVLVNFLRDYDCHYAAKSLVARALGKLAFPQFESLAPVLVEAEIKRAYAWLWTQWTLSEQEEGTKRLSFLSRLCKEATDTVIAFVLEVLTISGRLPDFELIAASLRSTHSKDRANAIEAIEQGCTRQVTSRLLPLLDARTLDETIDFYKTAFSPPYPSVWDVLVNAIDSPFQMASATAVKVLLGEHLLSGTIPVKENQRLYEAMRKKLMDAESDLVSEVIFSVLLRKHFPGHPAAKQLNIVDKAECIAQSAFFSRFSMHEIEWLARHAAEKILPSDTAIYRPDRPPQNVYVVFKGNVLLEQAGKQDLLKEHDTFGTEVLLGQKQCEISALSKGATVLAIPGKAVLDTAEIHPGIALGLLARKLVGA